jgi:formate hydrogenlyase subunit 3/multisubunit Na+/H+ antiporter MnhD subunit
VDAADLAIVIGGFKLYLLVDCFSAFFIAIISFMAMISAFYSIQYMEHYPDYSLRSYYINFPIFILGMAALVTVDDLSVGFTVAWQLMTVSSYFLVKFEFRKKENVRSANKYLALMELAWLLIVGATFLIDGVGIGDSLHAITEKIGASSGATVYIVYALILVGFGFKAGIFPLGQLWLPDAHSIAPSPISALLSGVMLKTGIYGIIRTFYWMVPHGEGSHYNGFFWGTVVAACGVVTLFIGTVQSMKQNDTKRLLAYSSIGQIGYIVFAAGAALLMVHSSSEFVRLMGLIAIVGALYHIINHAVFKGLLFLTSGSVLYATGTKNMNALGGLLKLMPVSGIIAAIASLAIAGVPPLNGFASKWTIISTSLLAGSEMVFLAIFGIIALFTSAITLACYVKFFGMTFAASGSEWTIKKEIKEVPALMLVPKVILTLLCIVQGIIPYFYFTTIIDIFTRSQGSVVSEAFWKFNTTAHVHDTLMGVSIQGLYDIPASMAVPVVMLLLFVAAFLFARFLRGSGGSVEREAETWLCGYQDLHNVNRYKDSSMFAALKNYLWWTGGNVKK